MSDLTTHSEPLPAASSPAKSTWKRWLVRLLKIVVLGAVVVLLVREVQHQIANDEWRQVKLRPLYLILSGLSTLCAFVCLMTSQRMILRAFTKRLVPWRVMVPLAWVPLAGKYVPGKVAAVGTAVVLMRRVSIPVGAALSSFVMLDALPVLSGTVLGSFVLWDPAVTDRLPWAPAAGVAAMIGGLICLSPPVFGRLMTFGLRLLRRPPLDHVPTLRDYLGPSVVTMVLWVFHSLAVWMACLAVLPAGDGPALADFGRIVAITGLALVMSYFAAVLSPAGFGVREGVFVVLLSTMIPPAAAVAASISLRVVGLIIEAILFVIGLLMMRTLTPDSAGLAAEPVRT